MTVSHVQKKSILQNSNLFEVMFLRDTNNKRMLNCNPFKRIKILFVILVLGAIEMFSKRFLVV
jgi:hypothetical protein